ncbi:MAG: hypothetical protein CVU55_05740 [Deltaproteobacteria bacterium HGW-Deltaproteobacteria-13]|jgi:hypothetical protein|nr:MAG: hypothetical protein CVU55_05740 [Deltaproteobacteria bacterium HGW-Deltaproteobacteria-13]
MKKKITKSSSGFQWLSITLIISLLTIFPQQPAFAIPLSDSANPVNAAAMKLVAFCSNPKTGLDAQAVATLVDYVLEPKSNKEAALPKFQDATGAYYEFDTRINFSNFLQYAYNSKVPSVLMSPSSLRFSVWTDLPGEIQRMPGNWKLPVPAGKTIIIYGSEHEGITPDLNTGVYYEYGLKRTVILLNYKGKQALISVAKQLEISDVGKKGFVLGKDDDWNYYYSGELGSAQQGLGWVKSYIYDLFSVGVYVESGAKSSSVRSASFHWIRAGWSGINFVRTDHIIKGMKRRAKTFKTILESPNLPSPKQIAATHQSLSALPKNDLVERYTTLQQARQSSAAQSGKINANEMKKSDSYANISKEQMIQELMLEHLKITLGKPSLLEKKLVLRNN